MTARKLGRVLRSAKRLGVCGLLAGAAACSSSPEVELPEPAGRADDARFAFYVVDTAADGPAGVEAADMDGDGDLDLVVNFFGDRPDDAGPIEFPPGGITVYRNDGDLASWTKVPVLTRADGNYFLNEAVPEDLDDDGDFDLLVSAGFFVCEFNPEIGPCGALFWLEQTGDGWVRHDIVEPGTIEFFHRVLLTDIDGDGLEDLVTVGETVDDAYAQWYPGTAGGTGFEPTPHPIGQGGGSLPVIHDIDGDGDLDLASGEFFLAGNSFVWFEQVETPSAARPAGEWQRHVIDATLGRTIQLAAIPDLLGEGTVGWIGSNHVNNVSRDPEPLSGIYLLTPPDDLRQPWEPKLISDGIVSRPIEGINFQAAPGVFWWGDVDDDGDIDLTVSGDGDPRVFWFEQTGVGEFRQHALRTEFGQAAGGLVADLDGNGDSEVVFTSYDTGEVLIFDYRPQS